VSKRDRTQRDIVCEKVRPLGPLPRGVGEAVGEGEEEGFIGGYIGRLQSGSSPGMLLKRLRGA